MTTAIPSSVATTPRLDRPGKGDVPDAEQFVEMEVQPDAEHQQDDANLGELFGQVRIGHEPRAYRPRRFRPADTQRSERVPSVRDVAPTKAADRPAAMVRDQLVTMDNPAPSPRCPSDEATIFLTAALRSRERVDQKKQKFPGSPAVMASRDLTHRKPTASSWPVWGNSATGRAAEIGVAVLPRSAANHDGGQSLLQRSRGPPPAGRLPS